MTSHAKNIIEQKLGQNKIVQSHTLYPQDPITGEVTLDITLNAPTDPAANDAYHSSFTRNVSDLLFDKVAAIAGVNPSEVQLHDGTIPVISFTFDAEDWAIASKNKDAIDTTLSGLESPQNAHPHTYSEDIVEQVRRRISDTAQPINESFFNALANEENEVALADKLGHLNMSNVKLQGYGYNSIIMAPKNNNDFVIRVTAEDREKMHHIPQVLNPVFRDVIADDLWLEVLPKIRVHGVTDEHKNAMQNALEEQGLTLAQDDIGLLPLVDGTQLPISYDTTNIEKNNEHKEKWEWRDDTTQQPYNWENPAYSDTIAAYQEKFDAYEPNSSIDMDRDRGDTERIGSFAQAANESHVNGVDTSRHNSRSNVIGF